MILVKRIYNTGKITISGAIAEKYGSSTKNIISLIMIYALLLVNVGNYVSGAAAIATVLHVTLPIAAFITAIVSTFYFAFGGLKGIARVTMLHSALKYFGILAILWFALSQTGGFKPMIDEMPAYYWTGMVISAYQPSLHGSSVLLVRFSAHSLLFRLSPQLKT